MQKYHPGLLDVFGHLVFGHSGPAGRNTSELTERRFRRIAARPPGWSRLRRRLRSGDG
ncbi:MAG: hypothetical protein KJO67_03550 [Silicimonas sp.]|nr:hypothetical protein [Silicimonas sp.]NND41273.1 hypothetical protein [Silicimonas sp.]